MKYLLAIAVGPVQEFIAAARRTRDLWLGSQLLSDISRAVAKNISESGSQLIFPESLSATNVANVILAEIESDNESTLRLSVEAAKQAAQSRWMEFVDKARAFGNNANAIRDDVWSSQIEDVIEFYAAWVQLKEYKTSRASVMRLLAGRKNCRDFMVGVGVAGLPKSSLDGQRETILRPRSDWKKHFVSKLRVREGEQLDVVGFVKRTAEQFPFPSVSRIAADPWIRGNLHQLDSVLSACEHLHQVYPEALHKLDAKFTQYKAFPFEGTAIYIERHHEWKEESEVTDTQIEPLRNALERLPQPSPYLAVLMADGDRVGAAISKIDSAQDNRQFSKRLAQFATQASSIVKQHQGETVYAGGDDVLAFLPVDRCLQCARKLKEAFAELMHGVTDRDGQTPTLSAGIGIGHFMENLEDLVSYGRDAEKAAKAVEGKDALAIHLHKRGGAPIHLATSWKDLPDNHLLNLAELIRVEAIPGKLAYELRALASVYSGAAWLELASQSTQVSRSVERAIQRDVLRVIRDKQPRGGQRYMQQIESLICKKLFDTASLIRMSDELLIAKQIAISLSQSGQPIVNSQQSETVTL